MKKITTMTLFFTLTDDPDPKKTLKGRAVDEGGSLMIYVDGYGEGAPVASLILQDGRLRLITFPDINSEEATTIELEGAKG